MLPPLPQYQVMILAINSIDEPVWESLWRTVCPSWETPPCPQPRQAPVRCGKTTKEMAETYGLVIESALRRHGYRIVPAIILCEHHSPA